ncbi:hypothetical protein ABZO31_01050 [Streptomyces sp. HUAS MG47]|uniref:hypothetical protein n=1 Tax=Streptomyces solicamelliae TaxID=3231716 RepID=UPI0038780235
MAPSYAADQLAKALATAVRHPDAATRGRAAERGRRWRAVLTGIAEGRLTIGSRTPVAGLPAWVTPEVVRGGFATGEAGAGGPVQPYEEEYARRFGVAATRGALFAHGLTEPGLEALGALLDSGCYEVAVPEEAALLTVAWLVRAGEVAAAAELVEVLAPYADTLRFLPRPATTRADGTGAVHRRTVGEARGALERRTPNKAVETQREALTVWNPFADELLAHWLETADEGRVFTRLPEAGWYARGGALLARYRALAATHTRCRKHRDPKGNTGILIAALIECAAGRPLDPRRLGLVRTAAEAMVRRRGLPGSERHGELRRVQAAQAALPGHAEVAAVVAGRLAALPQGSGAEDLGPLVADVSEREAEESGVRAGTALPQAVIRTVEATLSAPPATLVERGVVPSAEVLAELVPQLVATTTAGAYPDGALRTLMAAHYRAFRNRRSLLLLNLEHQVRVEELPWVRAVAPSRRRGGTARTAPWRHCASWARRRYAASRARSCPTRWSANSPSSHGRPTSGAAGGGAGGGHLHGHVQFQVPAGRTDRGRTAARHAVRAVLRHRLHRRAQRGRGRGRPQRDAHPRPARRAALRRVVHDARGPGLRRA